MNATLNATVTRDAATLRHDGHSGTATFYRTDETGARLYELELMNEDVLLVDERDLRFL